MADAGALSPEAEAFRATLGSGETTGEADFDGWRRSQRNRRLLTWALTLALLSPGVLCFVFKTPDYVSGGLEVAGFGVNWWLRRERRRRLKEIVSWESPAVVK